MTITEWLASQQQNKGLHADSGRLYRMMLVQAEYGVTVQEIRYR